MSKNLNFSKNIIEFLNVLQVKNLEDKVISIKVGRFEKFIFNLGVNKMKNWGEGKMI